MSYKVKQTIVVRTKYPDNKGGTKGVRAGKLIAQACHASMEFMRQNFFDSSSYLTPAEQIWLTEQHPKIVLQVESEQALLDIQALAAEKGVKCHLIQDAGFTEFEGVPTYTCLALGPDFSDKIDEITSNLKMY